MKKSKRKIKGFTLVEVLIVVAIIGILATLIVPRFLSQPERAVIGEAQQMLGAIRRAQATYMDSTGNAALNVLVSTNSPNTIEWNRLGFQPLSSGSKFTYTCGSTSCQADRIGGSAFATITINYGTGQYACGGGYTLLDPSDTSKGCTPR